MYGNVLALVVVLALVLIGVLSFAVGTWVYGNRKGLGAGALFGWHLSAPRLGRDSFVRFGGDEGCCNKEGLNVGLSRDYPYGRSSGPYSGAWNRENYVRMGEDAEKYVNLAPEGYAAGGLLPSETYAAGGLLPSETVFVPRPREGMSLRQRATNLWKKSTEGLGVYDTGGGQRSTAPSGPMATITAYGDSMYRGSLPGVANR